MGENINGPSLIEAPVWLPNRLGRYYLYFAHHDGHYIRLAIADDIAGPWRMHEPGVLSAEQSHFPHVDPPEPPPEERPVWAKHMKGGYLYAHIASPDIHIDDSARQLRMYFHGLLPNGEQATRLALSGNGLDFTVNEPLLGPPYFRAFVRDGWIYTIAWGGSLWRSRHWHEPFEEGPNLIHYAAKDGIGEGFRHGETHVTGDTLYVIFTRMGDAPERLLYSRVEMRGNWLDWRAGGVEELLAPELPWEGTDLPVRTSTMGAERQRVRELRDACVFHDTDGETYLLYCGAGESGIGIAKLERASIG